MDRQRWAEEQIQSLIAAGVNPVDAEAAVQWVLDNVPVRQEPDEWIAGTALLDALQAGDVAALNDARAHWYSAEHVDARYRRLLDARPLTEDEARASDLAKVGAVAGLLAYFWITDQGRYYTAKPFRPVAQRRIVSLLERHVGANETTLAELTTSLHEGRLSPAVWQREMTGTLRRLHMQNRALGAGGWSQLRDADYSAIGDLLRNDVQRLGGFARDVVAGDQTLPQALNRARLYAGNARVHYWEAGRDAFDTGPSNVVTIERRTLGIAEHCGDCIDYHGRGWQMAGVLPVPGRGSRCLTNCRCTMEWREVPVMEVGEWIGTRR